MSGWTCFASTTAAEWPELPDLSVQCVACGARMWHPSRRLPGYACAYCGTGKPPASAAAPSPRFRHTYRVER